MAFLKALGRALSDPKVRAAVSKGFDAAVDLSKASKSSDPTAKVAAFAKLGGALASAASGFTAAGGSVYEKPEPSATAGTDHREAAQSAVSGGQGTADRGPNGVSPRERSGAYMQLSKRRAIAPRDAAKAIQALSPRDRRLDGAVTVELKNALLEANAQAKKLGFSHVELRPAVSGVINPSLEANPKPTVASSISINDRYTVVVVAQDGTAFRLRPSYSPRSDLSIGLNASGGSDLVVNKGAAAKALLVELKLFAGKYHAGEVVQFWPAGTYAKPGVQWPDAPEPLPDPFASIARGADPSGLSRAMIENKIRTDQLGAQNSGAQEIPGVPSFGNGQDAFLQEQQRIMQQQQEEDALKRQLLDPYGSSVQF